MRTHRHLVQPGGAVVVLVLVAASLGAPSALAVASTSVSHFAGSGTAADAAEGPAAASPLNSPTDLAVDAAGNLYVTDTYNNRIEKITPAGHLSYLAGTGASGELLVGSALSSPLGLVKAIAVGADGSVYGADVLNHQVFKVTAQGQLSIVAGTGTAGTAAEGLATTMMLSGPTGLGLDSLGDLLIADNDAGRVYKVTPLGQLSFFAGNGLHTATVPGTATATALDQPVDLALDADDNVYVSQDAANQVVKITPSGQLSFFAGTGSGIGCGSIVEGVAVSTAVCAPQGLSVGPDGGVYIAAAANHRVVKVLSGELTFAAGDGTNTSSYGGPATDFGVGAVSAVAMGGNGIGYLSDAAGQDTIGKLSLIPVTAPGAPTGVSATAGDQQADVMWVAPSSDGGATISSYRITLSPTVFGAGQPVTVSAAGSATSMTVGSLTNDTTYTVEVRATNIAGTGPAGEASTSVTPVAPSTVPGLPANITATPGDRSAEISFDAPASTGGSAIDHYEITWDAGQSHSTLTPTGTSPMVSTTSGLTNGTPYTFALRAVNGTHNGNWSASTDVTPRTLPGVPTGVTASSGDGEALVTWTQPTDNGGAAITGALVRATLQGADSPVTVQAGAHETDKTVSGLTNGETYTVTVAAVNAAGPGPWSDGVLVTPISLTASVTGSHVPAAIHVGGPIVWLSLGATLDKARSSTAVTLRSGSQTVASWSLTSSPAGTEFADAVSFQDDDVPAWGAAQWGLMPQAPGNPTSVGTSIRLHSLLGLAAKRSGQLIMIGGSVRAYHSVLNTYKPWNDRPIEVQRWSRSGWIPVGTLTTDPHGNVSGSVKIPWTTSVRLWTPDTAKIWGATSAQVTG